MLGDAIPVMAERNGEAEIVTEISLTQAPICNGESLVSNNKLIVLMTIRAPNSTGDNMTATRANSMTTQKGKDKTMQMSNDKTAQMAPYNKTAQMAAAQTAEKKTAPMGQGMTALSGK